MSIFRLCFISYFLNLSSYPNFLYSPGDAVVKSFEIEDDDLIILGTDGLFDNMYPQDIYAAVSSTSPRDVSWTGEGVIFHLSLDSRL